MDSGSFQKDPYNISDDEGEEFYSIRTRQRTAAKQVKRKNMSLRKPADDIEPQLENALLGENGLGLTAEEFSALPDSERKQLLEAVLQSKEEYKMQERKTESEHLDVHPETSTNKKTSSSVPAKLECSIPLRMVVIDTSITQTHNVRPSLNKFRLKRLSEVAAEDKVHMETVGNPNSFKRIKFNEDYFADSEASAAELMSRDERNSSGADKCKLSADETKLSVIDSAKKNKDSGLRKEAHSHDGSAGAWESNSLDLLTSERNVPLRTRIGERFPTERGTSHRCLLLGTDDNSQMSARNVSASMRKAETTEEKFLECPDLPSPCQLIRKYRVQATDKRPLFKQNGLDLEAHVRVICDYFTACEIRRYESYGKITPRTQWGKPIAIEVDKGRVSTRSQRPRGDVTETVQTKEESLQNNGNQTSDFDGAFSVENEELRKRLVIADSSDFVERIPSSTVPSESLDVSVELDNLWTQEDIQTRLRRSRQTKIGGGLAEDKGAGTSSRKVPRRGLNSIASDDENDPDFTPENRKKRIRVDGERSQNSKKLKKSHLGVVRSTTKHSRKAEKQIYEGCEAMECNEVGSEEGEGEAQECRKLAKGSSRQNDAGKCQTTIARKCNGNNSHAHSSTSPEDFYESRSAEVSTMEKHKFMTNNLMNNISVNHGDLDQCQINADLEDGVSSSPVFGRNSSFDTKQQVFPVFQKLVRPGLRENEQSSDYRNISSTSKNCPSKQHEDNEEVLSDDSSEGGDCNLDKSTKAKKHGGQSAAFAKTYQKKKVKNVADQPMIIAFAAPLFRIPKVTQMCPLCQQEFPLSSIEEHVQKCVQLDDERKSNQTA